MTGASCRAADGHALMHHDFYKTRILVVEDQHLMRELTIEALNSLGFLMAPGSVETWLPQVSPQAHSRKRRVDVLMLAEGMILAQDVRAKGNLLLKSGTRLLAPHIAVLLDMRTLLDDRSLEVVVPPQD